MRSAVAPPETFWLQKAIDGMPGVNGSSQLAGMRLSKFLHPEVFGQQLYESLPNAEEFKRQLLAVADLTAAYIALYALDHFAIVFEVFKSAHTAPRGVIAFPALGEQSLGLHSVFVTGYEQSGEVVRFVNSWGAGWGQAGHGLCRRTISANIYTSRGLGDQQNGAPHSANRTGYSPCRLRVASSVICGWSATQCGGSRYRDGLKGIGALVCSRHSHPHLAVLSNASRSPTAMD